MDKNDNATIIMVGKELQRVAIENGAAIAYIDVYKMLYPSSDSDKRPNNIPLHKIRYIGALLGEVSAYTYSNYGIFLSSFVCRKGKPLFPGDGYFQMVHENDPTIKIPAKEEKEMRRKLVEKHQNEASEFCKNKSALFRNYPNKN